MAAERSQLESLTLSSAEEGIVYILYLPPSICARCRDDPFTTGMMYNLLAERYGRQCPKGKSLSESESRDIAKELGFEVVGSSQVPGSPLTISVARGSPAVADDMETESQDQSQMSPTAPSEGSERVHWTTNAVLLFVENYRRFSYLVQTAKFKKLAWKKMAEALQARGYTYTADDCEKKFRSLKKGYKLLKDKHTKTGENRTSWEHFDLMDDLLAGDPSVNPVASVSSLAAATLQPTTSSSPAPSTLQRSRTNTPVPPFTSPAIINLDNSTTQPLLSPSAAPLAPHPTPTTPAITSGRGRKRRHSPSDDFDQLRTELKEMEERRIRREDERFAILKEMEERRFEMEERRFEMLKEMEERRLELLDKLVAHQMSSSSKQ